MKTIEILSISVWDFLRFKLLECRISSIEERIDKLQRLSLFYQSRFDNDKSEKIKNKMAYLSRRKASLLAIY